MTEVLTIDVHLTGRTVEEKSDHTLLTLPFDGFAEGPYFTGTILPGAADIQKWIDKQPIEFCATYSIEGTDHEGAKCTVHIVNRNKGGEWKPTVITDSKALFFLNGADCTAILDHRKQGPIVRIFTKLPE